MLDALYMKTIEKKDEISKFFNNITKNIDYENVKNNYNTCDFNKNEQDKNFAAIDGSFNKVKFMAGYVYAITSQTIISKSNQDIMKESPGVDISTISTIYDRQINKLLSLKMSIFELKSTIDTLKKHPDIDYMLLDGTISGTLTNYRQPEIDSRLTKILELISFEYIRPDFDEDEITLDIITENKKELIKTIITKQISENGWDIKYKDVEMDIILCLIGYEQLFCINYLLKNYKKKLICISKTSSTKNVFKENIPDIAVIDYACDKSGYSKIIPYNSMRPIRYVENSKTQVDFPILNLELSETPYKVFFTKLNNKSQALKIEIPWKIEDEKEIVKILTDLESVSINGYPHILKKAHDEVKISSKYMKRMTKRISLENRENRSVLN
ncbi:DNA double-strand break repair nuclease NurA [Methanosphaera sp. ISO3-F5]|uniref:DNA double-strand break repair nuclease NurA n=1 Tax=Methanosphaera sp. ISO3-F5 TaxID=1452353 RepID=UPI002B25AEB8|nr:DNA double-strand break repair nuclease NurA [Methanosphaera sp. ISO3-F5]WQH64621.1 DNA double-strand break repair nuclease NurA [Methanosphaera sp. ISO3-F5]